MNVVNKVYYDDSTCKLPQNITMLPKEQGGITPEEGNWYFSLVNSEYVYPIDRNKVFKELVVTKVADMTPTPVQQS